MCLQCTMTGSSLTPLRVDRNVMMNCFCFFSSEKDLNSIGNSPSIISKSPTTPMSTNVVTGMTRSITPIPLQSTPGDNLHEDELPTKCSYDDSMNT